MEVDTAESPKKKKKKKKAAEAEVEAEPVEEAAEVCTCPSRPWSPGELTRTSGKFSKIHLQTETPKKKKKKKKASE